MRLHYSKSTATDAALCTAFTIIALSALGSVGAERVDAAPSTKLTDRNIADAVEDELRKDHAVPSEQIGVRVQRGVATLNGEVDNVLAKRRAVRIAEAVKGVRAVVDRVTVKPPHRDDDDIYRDIMSAMVENPATDTYDLTASVRGGVVALGGSVDSFAQQKLAEKVAMGVHGVVNVISNIDVNVDTDRPPGDIRRDIEQALRWDVRIADDSIRVTVADETAILSGEVGSAAEKRLTKERAWVLGVREVDTSGLEVVPGLSDDVRGKEYVPTDDDEVAAAVRAALVQDPRVGAANAKNVDIDVKGSLVTLRGKVASLQAKRAAESAARHTTGALFVRNRLKVRPPEQSGDQVLTKRIGRAISRDPYVDRSDIRIVVVNGTVHLYGVVNSPWENTRLQEIVSRVPGVLAVEEHLVENYDGVLSYHPFVDDDYFATNGGHYARRPTSVSDRQIAREIRNDLWWSPYVDARIVNVSVDNGTAVLTGQVATWQQKRLATRNAYDGGAVKVVNRLQVVGRQ